MANFSIVYNVYVYVVVVGFCDNNAHPSSSAFLCLGLSNMITPEGGVLHGERGLSPDLEGRELSADLEEAATPEKGTTAEKEEATGMRTTQVTLQD